MMTMMKKLLAVSITTALTLGMSACSSDDETVEVEVPVPAAPLELNWERQFTAPADGHWDSLLSDNNGLDYAKYSEGAPMPSGTEPWKNNQYALGTTTNDTQIWYGTAQGVWCYWPSISMAMPMALMNFETERQACQMISDDADQFPDAQVFMYDTATEKNLHIGPNTVKNGDQYWKDMMAFFGSDLGIKKPIYDENGEFVGTEPDTTEYFFTFRAAGSKDGIVFMAGSTSVPQTNAEGVIIDGPKVGYNRIFAFDARTADIEYKGFAEFDYDTVRRWKEVEHPNGTSGLYWFGGADQSGGQAGKSPSEMLRWVGTADDIFAGGSKAPGFDVVSADSFNSYGAVGDFTPFTDEEGNQRFISSAWYHPTEHTPASMLYTNVMPDAGYTKDNKATFTDFFQYDDYGQDPVAALGAKFGANAVFGDYLYFGSYHQGTTGEYSHLMDEYCSWKGDLDNEGNKVETGPLCNVKANLTSNEPSHIAEHEELMMKSWRALSLFRIKLEDVVTGQSAKDVELLYGNEEDWVFVDDGKSTSIGMGPNPDFDPTLPQCADEDPSNDTPECSPVGPVQNVSYDYHWEMQPNKLNQAPKWGKEGFGHHGLVYTWTMAVHDDKLILGTWNATAGLFDIFDPVEGYKNEFSHDCVMNTDTCLPGDGQNRLKQNNPAYFLYNAVKDQNAEDIAAGRGGWLIAFENTETPGVIVDKHGFGNSCNNGVRNYVVIQDELYLGTASYCNIDEGTNDGARAGLEFYKYTGDNR